MGWHRRRGRERGSLMGCVMFILFGVTALCARSTSAAIMGDECDWTGSGLTSSSRRGVTPVYLRCSAGRITWLYPDGALRVLLRYPGQDREFRACIKIHPDNSDEPMAARLFLEGPRSLLPLYSANDGGKRAIRCFNSKNGQVAIYVEAVQANGVDKRRSDVEYDLQPLPKGVKAYDPSEECRPCTLAEMAHAFCTSDLVGRGIIQAVENKEDLEVSQLTVKITKLIRHTVDDFYSSNSDYLDDNSVYPSGNEKLEQVKLHVGQHCGVAHGLGEFVFMARRKLGDLSLRCAPRLEDWAELVNKLSEDGSAHCILRS